MPFRLSPPCVWPIPSGSSTGLWSPLGGRCSRQKAASAATPVAYSRSSPLWTASTSLRRSNGARSPLASRTRREILALRRTLKSEHYDAVLDLQGALRSAVIGRTASSRRFIGESRPRESAARWMFTERVDTHAAHVIEQDLELASTVAGDALAPVKPWLPVDPAAEAWADKLVNPGDAVVLINPGAGWGAKRWPAERYADVARALLNRGVRILVNSGPGEVRLADIIVKRTGGGATPLLCSVEQLIAITRRVKLAIAGDTGPLHLACALGRPVVGIYGPTDPSRNGPYRHAVPECARSPSRAAAITRATEAPEGHGMLHDPAGRCTAGCRSTALF